MNNSDAELARRRLLGFVWLFFVCFFNTVPLFIISVLANLDSVRDLLFVLQQRLTSLNNRSGYMFLSSKNGPMPRLSPSLLFLVCCHQQSLACLVSSCPSSCGG